MTNKRKKYDALANWVVEYLKSTPERKIKENNADWKNDSFTFECSRCKQKFAVILPERVSKKSVSLCAFSQVTAFDSLILK